MNFHAHVLFNELLRKEGILPIHAITYGGKLLVAKDRRGFDNLVAFKSRGRRRLKGVKVFDFSKFRPVMYIRKDERKGYEAMRKILGLDVREGDFSLESGGEDPSLLWEFEEYDLKVRQVFPKPPDGWINPDDFPENWRGRLRREIGIIREKGFEGYFYAVQRIVKRAKELGIKVGPGRGSAVGSLLAHALGITAVNPLEYGLLFERFISEGRKELPDVDLDVEDERRRDLIEALEEDFEFVSLVSTFTNLKEKALWRRLKEVGVNPRSVWNLLYGLPFRRSIHAAGVIVSAEDMNLPFYNDGNLKVCEYDMDSLKMIGVEKIDILGLKTLTFLKDLERRTTKISEEIPLNDERTFRIISTGMTTGIFQLESMEARRIAKYVSPSSILELSHVLALNRPGPLRAGLHEEYARRRLGKNWRVSKEIEDILNETLGLAIYQEQIMLMAVVLGGFDLSKADELRKAISKKDESIMKKLLKDLEEGMRKKGYRKDFIREILDFMKEFASYAFNKSHSVAYAHISYYLSYFKSHHFPLFLLSFIEISPSDRDSIFRIIAEGIHMGYAIKTPSIEHPLGFSEENTVTLPLWIVKGVNKEMAERIEKLRDRRVSRVSREIGPSATESLIKAGAFDGLYESRKEALIVLRKGEAASVFEKLKGKFGIKDRGFEEEGIEDRILLEREAMGFALSTPDFKSERPKMAEALAVGEKRIAHVVSLGRGILSDGFLTIFTDNPVPKGEHGALVYPSGEVEIFEWGNVKIECEWSPPDVKIVCDEKVG